MKFNIKYDGNRATLFPATADAPAVLRVYGGQRHEDISLEDNPFIVEAVRYIGPVVPEDVPLHEGPYWAVY